MTLSHNFLLWEVFQVIACRSRLPQSDLGLRKLFLALLHCGFLWTTQIFNILADLISLQKFKKFQNFILLKKILFRRCISQVITKTITLIRKIENNPANGSKIQKAESRKLQKQLEQQHMATTTYGSYVISMNKFFLFLSLWIVVSCFFFNKCSNISIYE